jgi:sulfate adenylyltransferase
MILSICATPRPGARQKLEEMGNDNVVAFQTRNPLHRIHEELTKRAAARQRLADHPSRGWHDQARRCGPLHPRPHYKALVDNYYDKNSTLLSLLPLAMRMAGPKEALLHAIIRRNHGANTSSWGATTPAPATIQRGQAVLRSVRCPGP